MDIRDAIKILDHFQLFEAGEVYEMPYSPKKVTEALEVVVERVKTMENK